MGDRMKKLISVLLIASVLFSASAFADVSLEALLKNGLSYVKAGEYEKAEAAFDIAMKMAPDDIRVYEAIYEMCFRQGDDEGALQAINAALEYAPNDGELYNKKADVLLGMGRLRETEKAFLYAEVCGSEPYERLQVDLYIAYYDAGEYADAIRIFEKYELQWLSFRGEDARYISALIKTGNGNKARELGLISVGLKDETIANAIENGRKLSLVPTEMENILDYPIFVSAGIYDTLLEQYPEDAPVFELAYDSKRVKVPEELRSEFFHADTETEDIFLISTSPSGNIRLYSGDQGLNFLVKDNEITVIGLNENRSAPLDEDGEKSVYRALNNLAARPERDGIVWSKNERYFIVSFPYLSMQNMSLYDLMFVDTETGDFVVTNNTLKKWGKEGFEHAHLACFDDADENIYYFAFVNADQNDGYKSVLKKYNMETGKIETLCGYEEIDVYCPNLCLTAENEIRAIYTPNLFADNGGLISFKETTNGWAYEKKVFDEISRYQSPHRYFLSENSGMEVVLNQIIGSINYLSIANEKLDVPGYNRMILLPVNGNQAYAGEILSDEALESGESAKAWGAYSVYNNNMENALRYPAPEYMNVLEMTLSPDGYYALLVTQYPEIYSDDGMNYAIKTGLCLIDLETLRFSEIELPDMPDDTILPWNKIGFVWNETNEVLLPSIDGMLYKLKIN